LLTNILWSTVGFVALIKCADFFVDGASSFARSFKIPTMIIGLTIVAFGTAAPELAISFNAHLSNNTDLMFGNVVGSNIVNIFVILGLAILIKPFKIYNEIALKLIPILLLVTLALSKLLLDNAFDSRNVNSLTRTDGLILILFFSIFMCYLMTILSNKKNDDSSYQKPKYKLHISIAMIIIGLIGIIIGGNLVVGNVAALAVSIGISQKLISITIVSIGTSLPELVTTVVAAKKGENDLAIGNIVGSNIFNICIVLGLPIVMLGEVTTAAFNIIDMVFMLIAVLLLWVFSAANREVRRKEAAIFIGIYCLYVGYVMLQ